MTSIYLRNDYEEHAKAKPLARLQRKKNKMGKKKSGLKIG
jgi:hypothetical protein